MSNVLPIVQVILAVLLVAGIVLQRSDAGLGSAFGQDSFGGVKYEKRGLEKTIFVGTIVIAILFAVSAFTALFVR
ncbi:MAG TPA: preprotein translocase subunit SecG [Candidatus Paceibacterota bacterium]